jgi:hypothetical protein
MQTNKTIPSKAFWPFFTFYFLFVVVGISDMIFSPKNVVLNSFDFIINNYYYYFLPFSILISYLVLDVFYKHHEYLILHIGIKILIHLLFSIVFISWGIVGSIDLINKIPSKSQDYVLTGEIIDMYKKVPYSGYPRTYDKTRYFVTIVEKESEKEYTLQIAETLYDDLKFGSNAPTLVEDTTSHTFELVTKTEKSIHLKIGWLNIIY